MYVNESFHKFVIFFCSILVPVDNVLLQRSFKQFQSDYIFLLSILYSILIECQMLGLIKSKIKLNPLCHLSTALFVMGRLLFFIGHCCNNAIE